MEHIIVAFNVVSPVFALIGTGYYLKQKKVVNEDFVQMAMKLIFNVCLPVLLYLKVSSSDVNSVVKGDSVSFITYVFLSTILIFLIAKLIAKYMVKDKKSIGTFVQGSFRSNYIIIGYSVLFSMFGNAVIERVALLVIVIVPLYNILAIWVLTESNDTSGLRNITEVSKKIIRNPLIVGILLGFISAIFKIKLPVAINTAITMLGSIGTPLGLLGIGAYLSFSELKSVKVSLYAVALKILIFPAVVTYISYLLGFSFMDSTIIFVLFGSPASISSFIMATALDGDSRLAANIVILGTGLSLFTFILGLTSLAFLYGV